MSSIVAPRARNSASGDAQSLYDAATAETLARYSAANLDEDFVGPGHSSIPAAGAPAAGYPWVQKTQKTAGSPTVAVVANQPSGVVRLALDATSEKQEATLYANDSLNWDMTKSAIYEARVSFHVVPTGNVEVAFGLQSAWIDGPDNNAYYARFQALGSGVINFQTKDGVNTLSNVDSTVMAIDTFHNFRIDATDPTNVRFFIDGREVSAPRQMSFAATGANAVLQPYVSVYKAAGIGVGSVDVDMIQVGANRS